MAQGRMESEKGGREVLIGLSRRDLQSLQLALRLLEATTQSLGDGSLFPVSEAIDDLQRVCDALSFVDTVLRLLYQIKE